MVCVQVKPCSLDMATEWEGPESELWETYTQSQGIPSNERLLPGLRSQGDLQSRGFLLLSRTAHTVLSLFSLRTVPKLRVKTQSDIHGLRHLTPSQGSRPL